MNDTASFRGLYPIYLITRKHKRNSADCVEFELHWQRNLLRLARDINSRTLQPTAYTFVATRPKAREVFACDMGQRICDHYIAEPLRPHIERRLTERTFNNRIGKGLNAAINQIAEDIYDKTHGFTRDAWCVTWDLEGYFPNACQDTVYEQFLDLLNNDYQGEGKELLRYLIERSIFSYPTEHCEIRSTYEERKAIKPEKSLFNKPPGIGGSIGRLVWQDAMSLYVADIDRWLEQDCGIPHVRYMDDNFAVTDNKEAFLAYIMPELRKRYAELGCRLHPHKFSCQHYSKGVKFCGTTVKMQRVYVSQRTVRSFRQRVAKFSAAPCERRLSVLLASINSYLGICKTRNGHHIAMSTLGLLSTKWSKYVHLDKRRMCLVANEGYALHDRLRRKYKLRLKHNKHDKTGKGQRPAAHGRAQDGPAGHHGRERRSCGQMHKDGTCVQGRVPRGVQGV